MSANQSHNIAVESASINELMHVLERMILLHQNLCELLQQEHSHMVTLDVNALIEDFQTKEAILNQIWSLEKNRIILTEKFGRSLGITITPVTVSAICEKLSDNLRDKFLKISEVLHLAVSNAKELNLKNRDFADSSLSRIRELKNNVLGLSNQASRENYSNSGLRQPTNEQGGRLLSTKA